MENLDWVRQQQEGQFFERKSCYEQRPDRVHLRSAAGVARDVAETMAAMANADGGILVLGVENDGEVTGVDYPADRVDVLQRACERLVQPPIRPRMKEAELEGKKILMFETDWSPEVHQLHDGRYVLRIGASNTPFPAEQIESIKAGKRRRVAESRYVPEASLSDLDPALLEELRQRTGLRMSDIELLQRYRLAEPRNGRHLLSLAALLLFAKDPGQWHPRCGIDFVKYEGTERHVGTALNVVKRERLEAPLVRLVELAYETIQPHIRERQRLVDLFFEEHLEYPTFAWQEAIVNAIAHRDYGYTGLGIEIWMFDDRMEIRSPGELVEPVTLERLRRLERLHASRNPRIARVLTDWGYMREQGEGLPRMFEAMEREGLYPPNLRLEADAIFTVTLRNTPVYSLETARWLKQFEPLGLSGNQKRLLAYAKEHDSAFTSRAYQRLTGVDIYEASRDIKDLIRKGIVRLMKKGGRIYEIRALQATEDGNKPTEFAALEPALSRYGFVKNADIRAALNVTARQANRIARRLEGLGWLRREGERRGTRYFPAGD